VENLLEYAVFHVVSQEVQEKEIGGRQLPIRMYPPHSSLPGVELTAFFKRGTFRFLRVYVSLYCGICRPLDSNVQWDRTRDCCYFCNGKSDALTTRRDLLHTWRDLNHRLNNCTEVHTLMSSFPKPTGFSVSLS
jgi:hypothetical protein